MGNRVNNHSMVVWYLDYENDFNYGKFMYCKIGADGHIISGKLITDINIRDTIALEGFFAMWEVSKN